eukprot:3598662-Pleurochrysis_carterae.AAC.2
MRRMVSDSQLATGRCTVPFASCGLLLHNRKTPHSAATWSGINSMGCVQYNVARCLPSDVRHGTRGSIHIRVV